MRLSHGGPDTPPRRVEKPWGVSASCEDVYQMISLSHCVVMWVMNDTADIPFLISRPSASPARSDGVGELRADRKLSRSDGGQTP